MYIYYKFDSKKLNEFKGTKSFISHKIFQFWEHSLKALWFKDILIFVGVYGPFIKNAIFLMKQSASIIKRKSLLLGFLLNFYKFSRTPSIKLLWDLHYLKKDLWTRRFIN